MLRFCFALALCLALALSFVPGSSRLAVAASPLPVATPQVDSASRAYLLEIADHIVSITDSLGSIGELFSNPQVGDDDWKIKVVFNLVVIRHAHEELSNIDPPTRLVVAHATLITATSQCNDATYNVADGIDNLDADLLKLAAQQVFECGQKIAAIPDVLAAALSVTVSSSTPTVTPSPTLTPTKTLAAPAAADTVIVARDANLRAGPGTNNKVIGTVKVGQQLVVIGRNPAGDWLQLDTKAWIAAFLVKAAPKPTLTPTATSTLTPSPTATTKATPVAVAPCSCAGDTLSCTDFATQPDAQTCFDYCQSLKLGDLHRLDVDENSIACEVLPSGNAPLATDTPTSAFASGGLGQSKKWWADFKKPSDVSVMFYECGAAHIERQWKTAQALTPSDAHIVGKTFAPEDATLVETYSPSGRPETTVNLYISQSLAGQCGPDDFIGGEPGNFTIQYNVFDGKVTRLIVALGNNP